LKKNITNDTNEFLKTCVNLLEDKHVIDIKVYDVREKSSITDFFLVGSVRNDRQMKAAGGNLVRQLKKLGIKSSHKDGEMDNTWVVLDFIDCIIGLLNCWIIELLDYWIIGLFDLPTFRPFDFLTF